VAVTRNELVTQDTSGVTNGTYTPSSLVVDEWMIVSAMMVNTTLTITPPAGWTQLYYVNPVGSRSLYVWAKRYQSADSLPYTFSKSASGNTAFLFLKGAGADPIGDWQLGTSKLRNTIAADDVTNIAPSITTTEPNVEVLSLSFEATTTENSTAPTLSGSGWTMWGGNDDETVIETIFAAYQDKATAGATGDATFTYTTTQASNGWGVQIGLTPAGANLSPAAAFTHSETYLSLNVNGTTSTDSDGSIASYDWNWSDATTHGSGVTASHTYGRAGNYSVTLTVTDNGGSTNAVTQSITITDPPLLRVGTSEIATLSLGGNSVSRLYVGSTLIKQLPITVDMWAAGSRRVAHRAGGTNFPEETLWSYQQCVALGWKCLEVSLNVSLDGVFVASHDATTNRVFNGNYSIASENWSTLSSLTATKNGYTYPIMRLEELLNAFGGRVPIMLDDKTNANGAALRAMIAAHGTTHGYDPTKYYIWKGYKGWSPASDAWRALGYKSWGIYYDAEMVTAPDRLSSFDYLGLNYDATGTNWSNAVAAANGVGKSILSHVIYSTAQLNIGIANGAVGAMVSDVVNIAP
jgi:PKD repeat protein